MVVVLIVYTQHKSRIGPFGGSGGLFGPLVFDREKCRYTVFIFTLTIYDHVPRAALCHFY